MPGFFAHAPLRHFHGDFWTFWSGQTISTLGSSVTSFALPLLVFKLTNSPLNLALTMVFTVLPYLLFGLAIGAWVDRTNRKGVMVFTDCARGVVIASIPFLTVLGLLSVWWIYVVSFVNATLTIGFTAANFAALPSLVEPDDLVAANGSIQASFSMASIIGPLVAGLLLVRVPLSLLLLIDAASFLVSAVSLLLVKKSFNASTSEKQMVAGIGNAILEGLHYVRRSPIVFWLMLLLLLFNFILPTADVQIVWYAKHWLRASDTQLGLLYASDGIGVVVFSLLANRLRKHWSFAVVALGSMIVLGLLTTLMAFTHWYPSALVIWALRGGTDVLFLISTYSMTQRIVPNALLGRVITFLRVLTWPTGALGALLGGLAIAQTGNVGLVYGCVGLLVFLVAFAFWLTPLGHAERYVSEARTSQGD
jgi:predicted MFS family arabinose efflux permease